MELKVQKVLIEVGVSIVGGVLGSEVLVFGTLVSVGVKISKMEWGCSVSLVSSSNCSTNDAVSESPVPNGLVIQFF